MKTQKVKISEVKRNPDNPRLIKDNKYKKLVTSIIEFPEMLEIRPIVVNDDMVVLGGNMRLKACQEAKLKEVPIIKASKLTAEQQREFIIKDNVGFGEWDWDIIANEWEEKDLIKWGLELPVSKLDDMYTKSVNTPNYEVKSKKPELNELVKIEKTEELINKIKKSNINEDEKLFLIKAAQRHNVFNYSNIAEYYAHSNKEMQELMEQSALVIIDFNKCIENGFSELTYYLSDIQKKDEE